VLSFQDLKKGKIKANAEAIHICNSHKPTAQHPKWQKFDFPNANGLTNRRKASREQGIAKSGAERLRLDIRQSSTAVILLN